jgi:hypothetical protein
MGENEGAGSARIRQSIYNGIKLPFWIEVSDTDRLLSGSTCTVRMDNTRGLMSLFVVKEDEDSAEMNWF